MAGGWVILPDAADYVVASDLTLTPGESQLLDILSHDYSEASRQFVVGDRLQARQLLEQLLVESCRKRMLLVEKDKADKVLRIAESTLAGLGFMDFLLADSELEEVSVIGPNRPVYVYHRSRGWLKTAFAITSLDYAVDLVNKMARPLGRRITLQSPRLDALLPDGSRLHATISPVAVDGFEVTIRKFRERPYTVPELALNGTMSPRLAACLWLAMLSESSVVVAGNTGGGKTTLLNALFSFVPPQERIVCVEQTPELVLPQSHVVRLTASEDLGVGLSHLVKDSLRMRPDRVVIGEVRDTAESSAFFDSLLAGQARGTYCTMHANSSNECLARLRRLGGGQDELDSIGFVIVARRLVEIEGRRPVERRRITELACVENGSAVKLFNYDRKQRRFNVTNEALLLKALSRASNLDSDGVRDRIEEMASFIEGLAGESDAPKCALAFQRFLE